MLIVQTHKKNNSTNTPNDTTINRGPKYTTINITAGNRGIGEHLGSHGSEGGMPNALFFLQPLYKKKD